MRILWIVFGSGLLLVAALWIRAMVDMPGRSHSGPLPHLSGVEKEVRRRLEGHVNALAGERNMWHYEALTEAASYIEDTFEALDLHVTPQAYPGRRERGAQPRGGDQRRLAAGGDRSDRSPLRLRGRMPGSQ